MSATDDDQKVRSLPNFSRLLLGASGHTLQHRLPQPANAYHKEFEQLKERAQQLSDLLSCSEHCIRPAGRRISSRDSRISVLSPVPELLTPSITDEVPEVKKRGLPRNDRGQEKDDFLFTKFDIQRKEDSQQSEKDLKVLTISKKQVVKQEEEIQGLGLFLDNENRHDETTVHIRPLSSTHFHHHHSQRNYPCSGSVTKTSKIPSYSPIAGLPRQTTSSEEKSSGRRDSPQETYTSPTTFQSTPSSPFVVGTAQMTSAPSTPLLPTMTPEPTSTPQPSSVSTWEPHYSSNGSATPFTQSSSDHASQQHTAVAVAIAAGVAGGITLLLGILLAACMLRRRRIRKEYQNEDVIRKVSNGSEEKDENFGTDDIPGEVKGHRSTWIHPHVNDGTTSRTCTPSTPAKQNQNIRLWQATDNDSFAPQRDSFLQDIEKCEAKDGNAETTSRVAGSTVYSKAVCKDQSFTWDHPKLSVPPAAARAMTSSHYIKSRCMHSQNRARSFTVCVSNQGKKEAQPELRIVQELLQEASIVQRHPSPKSPQLFRAAFSDQQCLEQEPSFPHKSSFPRESKSNTSERERSDDALSSPSSPWLASVIRGFKRTPPSVVTPPRRLTMLSTASRLRQQEKSTIPFPKDPNNSLESDGSGDEKNPASTQSEDTLQAFNNPNRSKAPVPPFGSRWKVQLTRSPPLRSLVKDDGNIAIVSARSLDLPRNAEDKRSWSPFKDTARPVSFGLRRLESCREINQARVNNGCHQAFLPPVLPLPQYVAECHEALQNEKGFLLDDAGHIPAWDWLVGSQPACGSVTETEEDVVRRGYDAADEDETTTVESSSDARMDDDEITVTEHINRVVIESIRPLKIEKRLASTHKVVEVACRTDRSASDCDLEKFSHRHQVPKRAITAPLITLTKEDGSSEKRLSLTSAESASQKHALVERDDSRLCFGAWSPSEGSDETDYSSHLAHKMIKPSDLYELPEDGRSVSACRSVIDTSIRAGPPQASVPGKMLFQELKDTIVLPKGSDQSFSTPLNGRSVDITEEFAYPYLDPNQHEETDGKRFDTSSTNRISRFSAQSDEFDVENFLLEDDIPTIPPWHSQYARP